VTDTPHNTRSALVEFPREVDEEEKARRAIAAAKHLASQSPLERNFWMPKRAEEIGVPLSTLQKMVEAEAKAKEKKEQEKKS
jgi:hypothetical protein